MTIYALVPHPARPSSKVQGLSVDLHRHEHDRVSLTYRILGARTIFMPEQRSSGRANDLWRTTCFELFLMFDDDEHYVEFNFSPSTQWAAYAFDDYREGMAPLSLGEAPMVERRDDGVDVRLNLAGLPHGELRMGLSAMIEQTDGTKSYWALAHPPGAPDFHHPACFAATLPAPARP